MQFCEKRYIALTRLSVPLLSKTEEVSLMEGKNYLVIAVFF